MLQAGLLPAVRTAAHTTTALSIVVPFDSDWVTPGHPAGGDLYRRLVKAGGKLGEAQVCREVVIPLLLTLTFLHANHIVHRCAEHEPVGTSGRAVELGCKVRCCLFQSGCCGLSTASW